MVKKFDEKKLKELGERLRASTEEAKKLPKDSPEFDWAKNLPQLPEISGGE